MISKVKVTSIGLKGAIEEVLESLGTMAAFVKEGDKVFIKPNFNTDDPYPASSDLKFIKAVVSIVNDQKPAQIILGDSPTYFGPSKKYFKNINPWQLQTDFPNLEVLFLNKEPYITKEIPKGDYIKKASIPKILDEVDKLIWLPCLKTHAWAKYTGGLKLAVGLLKPSERLKLHTGNLENKVAELNTLFKPSLIIMDARKCFITQGPAHGEIREPNLIIASVNRVELDLEGIKIIQSFEGNDLKGVIPEKLTQIKRAQELGIN